MTDLDQSVSPIVIDVPDVVAIRVVEMIYRTAHPPIRVSLVCYERGRSM